MRGWECERGCGDAGAGGCPVLHGLDPGIKATIRSGSDDGRSRVTGRWPRCLRSVRIRVQEPRPELGALVGFEPSAVHVTLAVDAGRKREARALRMPLRGGTPGRELGGSGTRLRRDAPVQSGPPGSSASGFWRNGRNGSSQDDVFA